jgi:glycosyltransferase involved in cell wall biosynthesis
MGEQGFRYSVVVPVLNEHEVIGEFCAKAVELLPPDYEVLICYDNAADTTLPAIAALPADAKPRNIRFVQNTLGRGVRYAIDTGMRAAKAPIVLVTMADLSDDFKDVDEMVRRAEQGADVVTGSRYMPGGRQVGGPKFKGFLSRIAGLTLYHVAGLGTHDPTNSFKAYRKDFLDNTPIESEAGFVFGMELTLKSHFGGGRVEQVPTTWLDRTAGESRFRLMKWLPIYLHWFRWAFRQRLLGRGPERDRETRRWTIAERVARGLLLAWLLLHCVPWAPAILLRGIESSWRWTLHHAAANHLVFGRDIAFTFGPLGFLYDGYFAPTYPYVILCWSLMTVAFWAGVVRIVRLNVARRRLDLRVLWYLLTLLAVAVSTTPTINELGRDGWFIGLLLLLLLNAVTDDNDRDDGTRDRGARPVRHVLRVRRASATLVLLAVATAVVTLMKFSLFIAAFGVIGLITFFDLTRRRVPLVLLIVLACQLAIWLLARQPLSAVPAYLQTSWEITTGYGDAMSLSTREELLDVAPFVVCVGALLLSAMMIPRPGGSLERKLLLITGLAWLLFLAFKAGYVRHDTHELHAACALVLTYTLAWVIVWPSPRPKEVDDEDPEPADPRRRRRRIVFTTGAAVMVTSAVVTFERYASPGLPEELLATIASTPRRVAQMAQAIVGRPESARILASTLQSVRARAATLPAPRGSADIYTYDSALLLVSGARFNPRPVFQSYSAYTPHLAEMNAAHLRGDDAPDSVLFSLYAIDRRWTTLEDGPSYLELLSRYDPGQYAGTYWLMTRRPTPRPLRLEPFDPIIGTTGDTIQLPDPEGTPLYAQLDVKPTLAHKAASLLYKSRPLYVTVKLADGRVISRRLVPGMARAGFILSPCLMAPDEFGPFWNLDPKLLADARPISLSLGVREPNTQKVFPSAFYGGYELKLFRVHVGRTSTTATTRPSPK